MTTIVATQAQRVTIYDRFWMKTITVKSSSVRLQTATERSAHELQTRPAFAPSRSFLLK